MCELEYENNSTNVWTQLSNSKQRDRQLVVVRKFLKKITTKKLQKIAALLTFYNKSNRMFSFKF